jgi:hypothetical protein
MSPRPTISRQEGVTGIDPMSRLVEAEAGFRFDRAASRWSGPSADRGLVARTSRRLVLGERTPDDRQECIAGGPSLQAADKLYQGDGSYATRTPTSH